MISRRTSLIVGVSLLAASVGIGSWSYRATQASRSYAAEFVGRESCAACHAGPSHKFTGSHHDLAMDLATPETVVDVAAFDGREFTHFGVTSKFFRRDDKFFVTTEGEDGRPGTFEIKYVFGVDPLQQYMVEFPEARQVTSPQGAEVALPAGRIQVLSIAWDTHRSRWFALYPQRKIPAGDWLHWTGGGQNWNFMCADCHSTHLRKNFDLATNAYRTEFSEIDVSCEACHGPAGEHVARARSPLGFLDPRHFRSFALNSLRGAPALNEIQTCAPCHSRRQIVHPNYSHRLHYDDFYEPSGLEGRLYHADGQIREELYEYGSFLQSRMFREGVRCSNCHDPHSLQPKFAGNALCTQCHTLAKYDTPGHHHHAIDSSGSRCVECHMPETTYMEVDPRRDHSIRVPRPDLTLKLGVPNACVRCHDHEAQRKPASSLTSEKAAAAVESWFPQSAYRSRPHYGEVLEAGRRGDPHAAVALADLARDKPQLTPEQRAVAVGPIVRSSAVALLGSYADREAREAIDRALGDADPTVRAAAVRTFAQSAVGDLATAKDRLVAALDDRVRSVRTAAANVLLRLPRSQLSADERVRFQAAFDEWLVAARANSDTPGGSTSLGTAYVKLLQASDGATSPESIARWTAEAEAAFRRALRVDPLFVPALVELAQLYDLVNRDAEAEASLRRALALLPELAEAQEDRANFVADLHYRLGWLLLRDPSQSRLGEAAEQLALAVRHAPAHVEARLHLGVAQLGVNRFRDAEETLTTLLRHTPAAAATVHEYAVRAARERQADTCRVFLKALVAAGPQPPHSVWADWQALVEAAGGLE